MTLFSTPGVLKVSRWLIYFLAHQLPLPRGIALYAVTLSIGPLFGSLITEPAAMTVTAFILLATVFKRKISMQCKYATLGLLFVNISVGGMLTPYAAPPLLMVARTWGWDLAFVFRTFGWKAILAIIFSTSIITFRFRRELEALPDVSPNSELRHSVQWLEALKIAFFLAGLVVLGAPQRWWIEPILLQLQAFPLYLSAIGLTAVTDNAALTYLGAQVPDLGNASRYALVAGAVVGGGLTLIANAPNLVGYGILSPTLGSEGIRPWLLFKNALLPTLLAAVCFWLL